MTIRIILVDDHAVVRSGLNMILSPEEDVKIVAEAGTAGEAIELAQQEKPDVMLMDIHLPDLSGIEATKVIKEKCPEVKFIAHYGLLGPYDFMDIYEAPDEETANNRTG